MKDMKAFFKAKEHVKLTLPESTFEQLLSIKDFNADFNSLSTTSLENSKESKTFSKIQDSKKPLLEDVLLDNLLQEVPLKRKGLLENIFFKIGKK